jgi:uncharacterized protein (DUF697 family)
MLRRAQTGEFDQASEDRKAHAISDLLQTCSSSAAVLALQPFPGVDSAIVTPIHHRMIEVIARIRGYPVETRPVYDEVLGPLGGKLVVPHLAMLASKIVPFADIFGVSVAYALTRAIGCVSDEYYRRGQAMEKREMRAQFTVNYKKAYEHAFKERRNELRAMFRNPEVRRKVRELKKARRDGTIAADEVERKIDEALRSP